MKNLLLVLSLLLFAGLACDAPKDDGGKTADTSTSETTEATPDEKAVEISATALTKAYEENELAADEKYKGKTLEVSGTVSNIAETLGSYTVQLKGHNIVLTVMCSFEESEKSNIAKLKKGQKATLIGKGDGFTAGLYAGMTGCKVK